MKMIEADYDGTVLRPTTSVPLRPGERVGLILVRRPDAGRWDLGRLASGGQGEAQKWAEAGLGEWADALDREDRR